MYKITFDSPTIGKHDTVAVQGLGELENGKTYEFENAVQETFRQMNAFVRLDDEGQVEVVPGPTLRQAFKGNPSIKVEFVKDKPGDIDPEPVENPPVVDGGE